MYLVFMYLVHELIMQIICEYMSIYLVKYKLYPRNLFVFIFVYLFSLCQSVKNRPLNYDLTRMSYHGILEIKILQKKIKCMDT